jgi:hypothetical protein
MALRGDATGSDKVYADALAHDEELACFSKTVTVAGENSLTDLQAEGLVVLKDGRNILVSSDLAMPMKEDDLARKLKEKAIAMTGQDGENIWNLHPWLAGMSARDIGGVLSTRPS